MKIVLKPNEMIIRAGTSNFRYNDLMIQGKLIVTNQCIYFKTLKAEDQEYNREISPAEICDLIFFNICWILPYGMNIITRNGSEHPFTVKNRNEWARLITKMY